MADAACLQVDPEVFFKPESAGGEERWGIYRGASAWGVRCAFNVSGTPSTPATGTRSSAASPPSSASRSCRRTRRRCGSPSATAPQPGTPSTAAARRRRAPRAGGHTPSPDASATNARSQHEHRPDHAPTVDRAATQDEWLIPCGHLGSGRPMAARSTSDPRIGIAALLDALEAAEARADALQQQVDNVQGFASHSPSRPSRARRSTARQSGRSSTALLMTSSPCSTALSPPLPPRPRSRSPRTRRTCDRRRGYARRAPWPPRPSDLGLRIDVRRHGDCGRAPPGSRTGASEHERPRRRHRRGTRCAASGWVRACAALDDADTAALCRRRWLDAPARLPSASRRAVVTSRPRARGRPMTARPDRPDVTSDRTDAVARVAAIQRSPRLAAGRLACATG